MSLSKSPTSTPTYQEEISLLKLNYSLIAGIDEVGRGTLAGPVVAAAIVLAPSPKGNWVGLVRDSKQMTPNQREHLLPYIRNAALSAEIGPSTSIEIDDIGIVKATYLAMKRALGQMAIQPQFLLIDAVTLPGLSIPQKAIVHGDSSCLSIAAASIVAKVARDKMMRQEDVSYPGYGFAKHKGYGTRAHLDNLNRLGPSPIHRLSFKPVKEIAAHMQIKTETNTIK